MIDRLTPTYRPAGRNDGTQSWHSLLFCHWQYPVDAIRKLVPSELEIDTFDGVAFMGIVPFKMRSIRPRWFPSRFAMNFLETNVRTYVVHQGRPGVFFFSLDANSRLAVKAARWGWSLPYHYAQMSEYKNDDLQCYESKRPNGCFHRVSFRVEGNTNFPESGTLEHFLLERYLMFIHKKNRIYAGQVHHRPYEVSPAQVEQLDDQLLLAAGLPAPGRRPDFAHYSPGVDVEVFGIKPVH